MNPDELPNLVLLAALDRAALGPFEEDGTLTEEARAAVDAILAQAEEDGEALAAELAGNEEESFGEGEPCKPGEAAAKTGCVPARGAGDGQTDKALEARFDAAQKDLRTGGIVAADPPVNEKYVDALAERMAEEGWVGRPLLVVSDGEEWQAWTGSHRLGAAQQAGLDTVPAIVIRRADVEEAAEKAGFDPDIHPNELDDEQKAELFAHLDNELVKELIRLELAQGGRAFE